MTLRGKIKLLEAFHEETGSSSILRIFSSGLEPPTRAIFSAVESVVNNIFLKVTDYSDLNHVPCYSQNYAE